MDKESERPTRVEVGSKWRLRNACEGHPAGEVVTVVSRGRFDTCAAHDCGDGSAHGLDAFLNIGGPWSCRYSDAEYLAPAPGSRQAERPKPAKGQRWAVPGGCINGHEFDIIDETYRADVWQVEWDAGVTGTYGEPALQNECTFVRWNPGFGPRSTQSEPAPTAPHDQTLCTYCQGGIACPEFARMFKAGNVSVIAPTSTPRAAVPPKPLDRCTWNTQAAPGMLTGRCTSLVSHAKSPYCETHIFEAMEARRRPAPVEQPASFHQSHPLIAGGVISLRAGRGGR